MNKQFLLTLPSFFFSSVFCNKRLCTKSTCPQTLVTGMGIEDDMLVLYLYYNVYHLSIASSVVEMQLSTL